MKIIYKKWWHRFIPRYRRGIKMLNILANHWWDNGGKEEHQDFMRELIINGDKNIEYSEEIGYRIIKPKLSEVEQ